MGGELLVILLKIWLLKATNFLATLFISHPMPRVVTFPSKEINIEQKYSANFPPIYPQIGDWFKE